MKISVRARLAVASIPLVLIAGVILTGAAGAASVAAQTKPSELTLEWIFGPEGRSVAATPLHTWLENGHAVLYDVRRPPAERTLETLDPATGERRPMVDAEKARDSLGRLLPKDDTPPALPWPVAMDGTGQHALYMFAGDVFVLDLASARFTRLTATSPFPRPTGLPCRPRC